MGHLERSFGVAASVGDFRLGLRAGRLEIWDLTLGVEGQPPAVQLAHLSIEVNPRSFLGERPVRVRRILASGLVVDLGAPIPELPAAEPGTPGKPFLLPEIAEFAVIDSRILPGALPDGVTAYLSSWEIPELALEGSLVDGALEVQTRGAMIVQRTGGEAESLSLEASATGPAVGPWRVTGLTVAGDGLHLDARGIVGIDPVHPLQGTLLLTLTEPPLVPELTGAGEVSLQVDVDLRAETAVVRLEAPGVALEVLEPLLEADVFAAAGLAGTTGAATLAATLGPGWAEAFTATGRLRWERNGEVLIRATAGAHRERGDAGILVDLEAELLPGDPGRRTVAGTASLPGAELAGAVTIRSSSLNLEIPDLGTTVSELRRRWPGLLPELPSTLPLQGTLMLTAHASGPATAPQLEGAARWEPIPGSAVTTDFAGAPLVPQGRLALSVADLPLRLLDAATTGLVSAELQVAGDTSTFAGRFTLAGEAIHVATAPQGVDWITVTGAFDQDILTLERLETASGGMHARAQGWVALELPLRRAGLSGTVHHPAPGIERLELESELENGVFSVSSLVADTTAGPAAATLLVPLGASAALPGLAAALAGAPVVQVPGPVFADVHLPEMDTCTLLPFLGMDGPEERVRGELRATLWLDPAQPAMANGTVTISRLIASAGDAVVTAEGPVEFAVASGTVRLHPVGLASLGARLGLAGEVSLNPDWALSDPPATLVTDLTGELRGTVDTALANPFLEGGVARGPMFVAGEITGSPAEPRASLALVGPEVEMFWPFPYPTRVTEPTFQVEWRDGRADITTGFLRVNRGTVDVGGTVTADGAVDLAFFLADLRYRLDYGLMADLSGDLRLRSRDDGLVLSGRVVLDRGVLDRDIDLDRELLAQFLTPTETMGTEADPLEAVALDLGLETVHGVRVRNNLADILATWAPIAITGTAASPVLRGRVDLERGGLVFAYGQTLRIDRGRLVFTGDPLTDPVVELATTSSLQDPTIAALPGDLGALDQAGRGPEERLDVADALTSGVAGYVGERLGSRIAQSLGVTQVSVRPVMVFGEADPSARLTVTQDLSRHASFAVSLDLRNTERQLYMLDLHGFRHLPRFTAQLFTTDSGQEGTTVQQVLELGGTRRRDESLPILRRLDVPQLEGVSRRTLRRAVRLRRGQPIAEASPLDVELEVAQLLRERGYPDAQVTVISRPVAGRRQRVDMEVTVEPGPRVEFRFIGDQPPRWARRSITTLYRTDFLEPASREDVRRRTVRVFRTLGCVDPVVEVSVDNLPGAASTRMVTVATAAGTRASLQRLEVLGLPPEESALLAGRFPGTLERAELASGTPDARRRVVESLRALGYAHGRLESVTLSPDGRTLLVVLEPGDQARLVEVAVRGVHDAEAARLLEILPLAPGQPARRDLLTRAALMLEEDLLAAGFPDARVRTVVSGQVDGDPLALAAIFEVTQGPRFSLGEVALHGLRGTRPGIARRLAGLEPGSPFRERDISEARGRLFDTGVFSAVTAETRRTTDNLVRVTLGVEEKPRWILGYGVRLESGEDPAAVVDVVDHNFLGRALTAGTRLLYETNIRSGRLYLRTPGLPVIGANLETYAERRRVLRGFFQEDITEAALQLSRPLTPVIIGRVYARYADTLLSEREPDPFFPFPDIRIRHPYLGAQLVWDTRDSALLARRGVFASLDLSGSGDFLGSDFRYIRVYGQFNTFRPVLRLGDRQVVWGQSLRAGFAHAFDQELLSSVRFFTGGEFSVRGYPREGLGPRESLGGEDYATGGEAVFVLNQELRIPLAWDISGVLFFDAGQVWAEGGDFLSSLATATGLGLRAMTPIGVLRLDVAFPLDRRPEEPRHRFYAGFGTTF